MDLLLLEPSDFLYPNTKITELKLVGKTFMTTCDYSYDGEYLATGTSSGNIVIWDLLSYNKLCSYFDDPASIVLTSWSKDNKYLISVNEENTLVLWDNMSGKKIQCIRLPAFPYNINQIESDELLFGIFYKSHHSDIYTIRTNSLRTVQTSKSSEKQKTFGGCYFPSLSTLSSNRNDSLSGMEHAHSGYILELCMNNMDCIDVDTCEVISSVKLSYSDIQYVTSSSIHSLFIYHRTGGATLYEVSFNPFKLSFQEDYKDTLSREPFYNIQLCFNDQYILACTSKEIHISEFGGQYITSISILSKSISCHPTRSFLSILTSKGTLCIYARVQQYERGYIPTLFPIIDENYEYEEHENEFDSDFPDTQKDNQIYIFKEDDIDISKQVLTCSPSSSLPSSITMDANRFIYSILTSTHDS
ncbi:hypothetical protein WA158_002502 [Blastocystis sp. Blastoise]